MSEPAIARPEGACPRRPVPFPATLEASITQARTQTDRQVSRSFKITYYIWGIPMSVTAKYN